MLSAKMHRTHISSPFLLTLYHCRSPWSNQYEPALDDGAMPSERLRKLEIDANTAFDQYREMYFEGGVSSVYLWDLDHGFAGRLNEQLTLVNSIKCTVLLSKIYTFIGRSYSYQEGWWRGLKEDQGLLGLNPCSWGSGEELWQVGPLQTDQHQHALVADQQGQEWHHEPWGLTDTPGMNYASKYLPNMFSKIWCWRRCIKGEKMQQKGMKTS